MNPNRKVQRIQHILINARLLPLAEKIRYGFSVFKYRIKNKTFITSNPSYKVPPKALAYDAYSAPDWDFYKDSGEKTALALFEIACQYLQKNTLAHVLEWGCGPARVIRHIHHSFGVETEVWGCDYNPESIKWCANNISDVKFLLNALTPPLPFYKNYFDFIYSISVFTHLSELVSQQWIDELHRITRPNGILVISTNGDSRLSFLLPEELSVYKATGILIRDKFEEGKKMFWACHSPKYLREKLFKNFTVLDFVPEGFPHTGQDMWVLRKPASHSPQIS